MPNPYFQFKRFTVYHDRCAMKVTTDACLFGAWCAEEMRNLPAGRQAGLEFENVELLDIGTGSGLLALMIMQKNKLRIDAVEIDQDSAGQAGANIKTSPWADQIKIFHQNILDLNSEKKYELIVSNPPFYENELEADEQRKNIARHSTELKLTEVLQQIKNRLKDNGVFFLLLPAKRSYEIERLLGSYDLFIIKKNMVRQSTHHEPFRIMVMGTTRKWDEIESIEISIRDENAQYTTPFIALLKDYYLYL